MRGLYRQSHLITDYQISWELPILMIGGIEGFHFKVQELSAGRRTAQYTYLCIWLLLRGGETFTLNVPAALHTSPFYAGTNCLATKLYMHFQRGSNRHGSQDTIERLQGQIGYLKLGTGKSEGSVNYSIITHHLTQP